MCNLRHVSILSCSVAAANWFEEVKEKKERRETGVKTRDKSFKMKGGEKEMLNATTFHLGSPPPRFFFFFLLLFIHPQVWGLI